MSGYYNCSLILYFPDNTRQIMIITASTYFCLKNIFYIYRETETQKAHRRSLIQIIIIIIIQPGF
jgi:hypothetical protein